MNIFTEGGRRIPTCAICSSPVDPDEAHYPHREGCPYLESEYRDCECTDAVHPYCCARCEQ